VRKPARDRRVAEAQRALALLDFDREQTNERSALVLLALLGLRPSSPWSKAGNPRLRTVELMGWLRDRCGRDYKPNTRETIRRQTLHQFIEAGLVLLNPDDPARPVNSPNSCYQIEPSALELLSAFGTDQFASRPGSPKRIRAISNTAPPAPRARSSRSSTSRRGA